MLGYTRKKIRSELVTALSAITSVGGRVSSGEVSVGMGVPNVSYVLGNEDYNASAGVMVSDDSPSERTLNITIEARALLRDGSETPVDDLCLEIEKEIASATTLNQWCKDLRLDRTEYEIEENNTPIGLARLEYVGYYDEALDIYTSSYADERTSSSVTITATTPVYGVMTARINYNSMFYDGNVTQTSGTTHIVEYTDLPHSTVLLPFWTLTDVAPNYMDSSETLFRDNDGTGVIIILTP